MNDLKALLGISTNLLNGLDPSWMSADKGNDALIKTTCTLQEEPSAPLCEERGTWDFPEITLHDTPQSLLTTLLPYRIKNPDEAQETTEVPTGNMMTMGNNDPMEALETLSATLGVDLKKTGSGYALVRLRRKDCEIFHSSIPGGYLAYMMPTKTPKALGRAASSLKREDFHRSDFNPDTITPEDAAAYLGFFDEQGTHYVSGAVVGDEIFQVFQFASEPYSIVKKTYAAKNQQKLSGVDAVTFIRFTTPYQGEGTGYVESYGRLLSLSRTEQLTNPAELGKWKDEAYSKKESIFTPFRMGGGVSLVDLDKEYTGQAAIEIHLTSLTLFMEYSRRLIWESVYNRALLQKFPAACSREDSCPGTFVPLLNQEADVKDFKAKLDYIDVISQGSGNDDKQYRHVMAAADAFEQYDRWLQYTYLQPATTVEEFTPEGILRARAEQDRKTNDSLTRLQQFQSCTTDEIEVPVEIPVGELMDGGTHLFRVWNDFHYFMPYTDARILSVTARVDGIESTDSGQYDLRIVYTGRPFFNKTPDGTFMTFHTQPRERTYSYKVEGNQPLYDDGGRSWSEGVTMVTPYSVWEISLPQASNAGLRFRSESTVMVVLTFKLQARVKGTLPEDAVRPEVKDVIKSMSGSSKLRDWDVVFNMLLDDINAVLDRQYNRLNNDDNDKKKNEFKCDLKFNTETKMDTIKPNIAQYSSREFDLTYGYPRLKFLINSPDETELFFKVKGEVRSAIKWIGEANEATKNKMEQLAGVYDLPSSALKREVIDGEEKLVLLKPIDPIPIVNEDFSGTIKIYAVKGKMDSDSNITKVLLDLAQGTFSFDCLKDKLTVDERTLVRGAIKEYFVNHPSVFIINSLDTNSIPTLKDLKPNKFLFKILETPHGNKILQLYIRTNNREVTKADTNNMYLTSVEEPIPAGYDSSLMINNRIIFDEVLPKSIINGWKLKGADDGEKRCSIFTNAEIEAKVPRPIAKRQMNIGSQLWTYWYESRRKNGNVVLCEFTNMRISSQNDGTPMISYSEDQYLLFNERIDIQSIGGEITQQWNVISVKIGLTVNHSISFILKGFGELQKLQFDLDKVHFEINSNYRNMDFCGIKDIHEKIREVLEKQLPGQLNEKLKISFSGFSVFALQNLLFPCDYSLRLKAAYLPADMVLFGKIY